MAVLERHLCPRGVLLTVGRGPRLPPVQRWRLGSVRGEGKGGGGSGLRGGGAFGEAGLGGGGALGEEGGDGDFGGGDRGEEGGEPRGEREKGDPLERLHVARGGGACVCDYHVTALIRSVGATPGGGPGFLPIYN